MKKEAEKDYPLRRQVYMLICWQEQREPEKVTWRFSLEIPGSNQRRLYKSLDRVIKTIQSELDWNDSSV